MLELPDYKEVLEAERKPFDLASIFGKKDEDKSLDDKKQPSEPNQKAEPIWTKIKDIFKKKKK